MFLVSCFIELNYHVLGYFVWFVNNIVDSFLEA